MSLLVTRPRPRRRGAALLAATALVGGGLATAPSTATAAVGDRPVTGGQLAWGLSAYLNSGTPGRPNPLPSAYAAPAAFVADGALSTWAAASGTVGADGTATFAFDGTSVNFARTSGAWLTLTDPEVVVDAEGNGALSAVVAYGMSTTGNPGNLSYDPTQPPARPAQRVDVVDLDGNTAADATATDETLAWDDLDGAWSPELLDFLDGDAEAGIAGFPYVVTLTDAEGRRPAPVDLDVTLGETVARTAPTVRKGWLAKPTRSKGGRIEVLVAGSGGTPTGRVDVDLARGGRVKTVSGVLKGGKLRVRTAALPRGGRWTLRVKYRGDDGYTPVKVVSTVRVRR